LQLSVLLVIPRSRGRFNIDSENIRNLSARAGRSRDREFGARCFYLVWHKAFKDSDYKGCNVSLSIASNEMKLKKPARDSATQLPLKHYSDFPDPPPPPLAFVNSRGHENRRIRVHHSFGRASEIQNGCQKRESEGEEYCRRI